MKKYEHRAVHVDLNLKSDEINRLEKTVDLYKKAFQA